MAKHRKRNNRRANSARRPGRNRQSPSLVLVGTTATAAALSALLVFGHATNTTADSPQVELTAATIGIGGRGDPDAVNIPNKLQGNVLIPPDFNYIGVQYPAGFDIDNSVNAGVPVLDAAIKDPDNSGQFLMVVGYSEGAIVAEKVRRNLDPSDPGAPPTKPGSALGDDRVAECPQRRHFQPTPLAEHSVHRLVEWRRGTVALRHDIRH